MKASVLSAAVFLAWCGLAVAEPSQSETNGSFSVIAAVLPMSGEEFDAAWNTSRETSPNFDAKDTLPVGQEVHSVVMFAGATLNEGRAVLKCKTEVLFPDGQSQTVFDGVCFDDLLPGPATVIYLSNSRIGFKIPEVFAGNLLILNHLIEDVNATKSIAVSVSVDVVMGGS